MTQKHNHKEIEKLIKKAKEFFDQSEYEKTLQQVVPIFDLIDNYNIPEGLKKEYYYELLNLQIESFKLINNLEQALVSYEKLAELTNDYGTKDDRYVMLNNAHDLALNAGDINKLGTFADAMYNTALETDNTDNVINSLINIGTHRHFINKFDQAIKYLKKAFKLASKENSAARLFNIYLWLGIVYVEKYEYDKANNYYDSSLSVAESLNNDEFRTQVYDNKVTLLLRWGKIKEAANISKKAIQLARNCGNDGWLAATYETYAKVLRCLEQYDEAIAYYNRSTNMLLKQGYQPHQINWYNQIGLTYRMTGHYDKAMELFKIQLKFAEQKNIEADIAMFNYNIGLTQFLMGNISASLSYLEKSHELDLKIDDSIALTYDFRVLGRIYQELKDYKKSAKFFLEALKIDQTSNEQEKTSEDQLLLAELFRDSGNNTEAAIYYNKLRTFINQSSNVSLKADYVFALGRYYTETKDDLSAWECFKLALIYFKELNRHAGTMLCYLYLAEIEIVNNRTEEVFTYLKLLAETNFNLAEQYFSKTISNKESIQSRNNLMLLVEKFAQYAQSHNESKLAAYLYGWSSVIAGNIKNTDKQIKLKQQQALELEKEKQWTNAFMVIDEVISLSNDTHCAENSDIQKINEKFKKKFEKLWPEKKQRIQNKVLLLIQKGDLLFENNNEYILPLDYYLAAAENIDELDDDFKIQNNLHERIANVYNALSQHEDAIQNYQYAADFFFENNEFEKAATCYSKLVNIHRELEDNTATVTALRKQFRCLEKCGSDKDKMEVCNYLAIALVDENNYVEAEHNYKKAMVFASKAGDYSFEILLKNNLAYLYYSMNKIEKAMETFREALKEAENHQLNHLIASSNEGLAYVYNHIEEDEISTMCYDKCAEVYFELAQESEDPEDSIYYADKAKAILDKEEDKDRFIELLYIQAYSQERMNLNYESLGMCESVLLEHREQLTDLQMAKFRRLESKIYMKLQQHEKAIDIRKKSLQYSQKQNDLYNMVWDSYYIGESYMQLEETDNGLKYLNNSLEWAELDEDNESIAIIKNNLALYYLKLDQPEKALIYFNESLDIVKSEGNYSAIMLRLSNLSMVYSDQRQYEQQYEYLKQYLDYAIKQGDKKTISQAYYKLGTFYAFQQKHEQAVEMTTRAIDTGKNLIDNEQMASFLNDIALSYLDLNQSEKSISYLEEAYSLLQNTVSNNTSLTGLVLSNLAYRYLETADLEKAALCVKQNLDIQLPTGNESRIVKVYIQLGIVYSRTKQNEKARSSYKKALVWAERGKEKSDIIDAYKQLGVFYKNQYMLEESQDCFAKALKISEESDSPVGKIDMLYQLASLYYDKQYFQLANETIQKAESLVSKYSWENKYPEVYKLVDKISSLTGTNTKVEDVLESNGNPPATDEEIDNCISDLFDQGFIVPPTEYFDFLREMDGWIFNGNCFYGTKPSEYTGSLISENKHLSHLKYLKNRVVIGAEDEGLFLYNAKKKIYEIVDRMDGLVYEEFDDFQEFRDYLNF